MKKHRCVNQNAMFTKKDFTLQNEGAFVSKLAFQNPHCVNDSVNNAPFDHKKFLENNWQHLNEFGALLHKR